MCIGNTLYYINIYFDSLDIHGLCVNFVLNWHTVLPKVGV
jgi:hypothetical protein